MYKEVRCRKCGQAVKKSKDLVVANRFLSLAVYHQKCYDQATTKSSYFFMGRPLNTNAGTIAGFLALAVGLYLYLTGTSLALASLLFLPMLGRIASWLLYERPLAKGSGSNAKSKGKR